jgi:hypothetical protein
MSDIRNFIVTDIKPKFDEIVEDLLIAKSNYELEHYRLTVANSKIKQLMLDNNKLEQAPLKPVKRAPPLPSSPPPPPTYSKLDTTPDEALNKENARLHQENARLQQENSRLKKLAVSEEVEATAKTIYETNLQLQQQVANFNYEKADYQRKIDMLEHDNKEYFALSEMYRTPKNDTELTDQIRKLPEHILQVYVKLYEENQRLTEQLSDIENSEKYRALKSAYDNVLVDLDDKNNKISKLEEELRNMDRQMYLIQGNK